MTRRPLSRPARWRIFSLTAMSMLVGAHIAHWKMTGHSLSSIQLSEAGRLAAEGVANAALFFFATLLIATALFGRFFCGWGCKMLALQELCRWILGRFGIRPKLIRLRTLWLVPVIATFYIFFFPVVQRLWLGLPMPALRVELMSDNLLADVPGPGVSLATMLICCVGMVYVLGSLSFCKYGCPYSSLFVVADRLALGRIRLRGTCDGCARCTGACASSIRVHEEVQQYRMVASSDCMRCLECVSSCPQNALAYGWGHPALLTRGLSHRRSEYPLSLGEEVLLLGVAALSFLALSDLYDTLPLLLSISASVLVGYLTVLCVRVAQTSEVRLRQRALKSAGQVSSTGAFVLLLTVAIWGLVGHSLVIQYHHWRALKAVTALSYPQLRPLYSPAERDIAARADDDLRFCRSWGLVDTVDVNMKLAWLARVRGDTVELEQNLRRAIAVDPHQANAHFNLGKALLRQGRRDEARLAFAQAVQLDAHLSQFVPAL